PAAFWSLSLHDALPIYVEAVAAVKELHSPRHVFGRRGCHGYDDHRGLLALKLIHRAHSRAGGQQALKQVHLHVVGTDDENIVDGERPLAALRADPTLLQQAPEDLPHPPTFFLALLPALLVQDGDERQSRGLERRIRAGAQD